MLSIITPVWNQVNHTSRYLAQVSAIGSTTEVIIIDNGSTDETPILLSQYQETHSWLKVITNEENMGFAKANNQGAAAAKYSRLLFLNNDVLIRGDFVSPFIEHIKPGAICGPELLDWATGWNKFDNKILPYIHGWCLGIHRDTYIKLGGFDERYSPAYFEDLDLCYNALQQDVALHQIKVPILHISGQTGECLEDRYGVTMRHLKVFAEKWGFTEYRKQ